MYIDTHAHLYLEQFNKDIDEVVYRMKENNVRKALLPNIDTSTIATMNTLCQAYPDTFHPMIGLHPCSVDQTYTQQLKQIEAETTKQAYLGIGEIGLDYYWSEEYKAEQQAAFRIQLQWAKQLQLPAVIHCRNAFHDIINILSEEQDGSLTGVLHCFTGNENEARQLVELNMYLGIGGVLTFKKSGIEQAIQHIDTKHLILETDSPYLAPVPYRGKRNESAYIPYIARKLAEVKQLEIEEIARITTKNAYDLFGSIV